MAKVSELCEIFLFLLDSEGGGRVILTFLYILNVNFMLVW